jgi:ribosomal protein L35AE/L33A
MTPEECSNARDKVGEEVFMEFRLDLLERWYNLSAEERTEAMAKGGNDLRQHFERCFPEGTVVHLMGLTAKHNAKAELGRVIGARAHLDTESLDEHVRKTHGLRIVVILAWEKPINLRRSARIQEQNTPLIQTLHTHHMLNHTEYIGPIQAGKESLSIASIGSTDVTSRRESHDPSFVIHSFSQSHETVQKSSSMPSVEIAD